MRKLVKKHWNEAYICVPNLTSARLWHILLSIVTVVLNADKNFERNMLISDQVPAMHIYAYSVIISVPRKLEGQFLPEC